jgi:geranylgeranylglycerol-phosphate geranylgeranyltransferase
VADRAAALVELARPGNVLMAGVGALVGAIVAAGPGSWPATGAAALATGLVTGGGNALNDVTDRALDRRAHPQRPIPSGRLSTRAASLAAGVAFLLASGIAAWVSLELLGLVVAAEAVLIAYEGLAKDRVLVGNMVVAALVGATFLAGAVAVGELTAPVGFLAGLAFLANVAREIWKDDQDADHDVGRATFAQRYPRLAPRVAQAVTLGAIACSVLPLLAGFGGWPYALFVGLADAVFLAAVFADTSAIAQQRSKQAMMVALVAFALGGAL